MELPIRRVTAAGFVLSLAVAPSAWGAQCAPAQVHPRFLHPTSGQTVRVTQDGMVRLNGDIVRPAGCTLPGLSSVKLYFSRKTPATSGQIEQSAGTAEPPLQGGKFSTQKKLLPGGYIVRAELVRNDEGGSKFGVAETINFTVQEITLNPNAIKKAPALPTPK